MIHVVERGDPEEQLDMDLAKRIGETLEQHYPNHPWIVCVQGRALIIRHLAIAFAVESRIGRSGFGSVLPRKAGDTHKSLTQCAIKFGGELLEAFSLPRGAWDGRDPVVPDWNRRKERDFH